MIFFSFSWCGKRLDRSGDPLRLPGWVGREVVLSIHAQVTARTCCGREPWRKRAHRPRGGIFYFSKWNSAESHHTLDSSPADLRIRPSESSLP